MFNNIDLLPIEESHFNDRFQSTISYGSMILLNRLTKIEISILAEANHKTEDLLLANVSLVEEFDSGGPRGV